MNNQNKMTQEEALELVFSKVAIQDVHELVVNFKESQDIFLIRKQTGMRFKDFRLMVKHSAENVKGAH